MGGNLEKDIIAKKLANGLMRYHFGEAEIFLKVFHKGEPFPIAYRPIKEGFNDLPKIHPWTGQTIDPDDLMYEFLIFNCVNNQLSNNDVIERAK